MGGRKKKRILYIYTFLLTLKEKSTAVFFVCDVCWDYLNFYIAPNVLHKTMAMGAFFNIGDLIPQFCGFPW